MLCGDTTYTLNEIIAILAKEEIRRGTQEFISALDARYQRVGDDIYIEREDFNWDSVKTSRDATAESKPSIRYDVC